MAIESKKSISLCADDFGLNPGISAGILKLVHMQRLSAVSCMVNVPDFIAHARELSLLRKQIKIGLHFNLTEGYFLSKPDRRCFSLSQLLVKTHLHAVQYSFIANEFLAQLDQFVQVMQQLPDFIDGHQHVHQFPGIRQVILDLYARHLRAHGAEIRSTWPLISLPEYQLKARVLAFTGGKALHRQLGKLGIPHNRYFSGVYDFAAGTKYRQLFRGWLDCAEEDMLIMCHPADGSGGTDSIASARLMEQAYFASEEFLNDCEEYCIALRRFESR